MVAVPVAGSARPAASSGMHGSSITAKPAKAANGGIPRAIVPLSARKAERLDLNTVERRGRPFSVPEPAPRTHINGIPEAPTFRPTEEQWKNPFAYLKSIEAEGKKYGVIKIIPPDSWNPDFVIDTERFHFKTRKQELNSVEGGTRANMNYLDQLQKFHKQRGATLNRFPSVDKRPLDLYELKKAVERRGGFELVCKTKKWAEIGRDLGYSGKIMSSLSTSLKNSYAKWLEPYEQWLRGAKPSVQFQLEQERGGPYGTPSPAASPLKRDMPHTPSSLSHESPAVRASQALNASLAGEPENTPTPFMPSAMPAMVTGFTAVNAGGWTPANASSFTPVNPTSVNRETPRLPTPSEPPRLQTPTSQANGSVSRDLKRPLDGDGESEGSQDGEGSSRRSKRIKKSGPPTVLGSQMMQPRLNSACPLSSRERANLKPGDFCELCGRSDDDPKILLCDSCFNGYHTYCLDPPLKAVPENDWHCSKCLVGTGEFGFEEGGIYSLKQFQERARLFKDHHFASKMPRDPGTEAPLPVTEEEVEKEFWRLASNIMETVEVEYGADIHSTTHGSGFPTVEKQPRNPYTMDPWNLNVLPLDKESLFRYIKTDISGMTVPWLYVGMCFSTFCWHNEDHYAYSANYQHFGATKTWYGIPGEDAARFEDAMREAVPELFEAQPDLLFQLVTLLPPDQLKSAGVNVYAVDQRAGQLVITYPQAYHAGFNHGFNFNEAVNFAPYDWEPFGQSGIERLRDFRRNPCFSHDLLLMTAASAKDISIQTAKWLSPALDRALEREKTIRQYFDDHSSGSVFLCEPVPFGTQQDSPKLNYTQVIETEDALEEDYVCDYCKTYSYLSRWTCRKSKKVACLDHIGYVCSCESTEEDQHVKYIRYPTLELEQIAQRVKDRANLPQAWTEKFRGLVEDTPNPAYKALKSLLTEGERIPWTLPQLPDLRKFVEKCNEWVEEAQIYITRKQQSRRKSEKISRKASLAKLAEAEEKEKEMRKLSNIRRLLKSADHIGFECPEIQVLQERLDTITEYQEKVQKLLLTIADAQPVDLEELIEVGKSYQLDIPEIEQLERILRQITWRENAKSKVSGAGRTLQEVESLIDQAGEINVPEQNGDLVLLKQQKHQGEIWEEKAKELMAMDEINFAQLDSFASQAADLPVSRETLAAVDALLRKQRELQELIYTLVAKSQSPEFRQRPAYKEVKTVMESLTDLSSKPAGIADLEKEQKRHEDWMRRGKKLFGKSNAPLHILLQHMETVESHNNACFNLSDRPRGPVEPQSREHTPEDGMAGQSSSSRDVFCLCRTPEAGLMIECINCHEWYHSKCLKIARGKVKEDDDFVCPICDWRVKIPRDAHRPKLEELTAWQSELQGLPFQPEEEKCLTSIIDTAQAFREYLAPYTTSTSGMMSTIEEVPTQRFYLRKLEGADVLLAYESNFFRQELHRLDPHAPEAPPILQESHSTRKPRPTKQQKLMAAHGVETPEELPEHLRTKPFRGKKKSSEEQTTKLSETPGTGSSATKARNPTPQQLNFRAPLTAITYPVKHPQYGSAQPQLSHTSPSELTPGGFSNPYRPSATATSLPAIGSPPAFGKGITASPPRQTAALDYSNALEMPSMPWLETQDARNRQPYDPYGTADSGQTSNFDSMFADLTNADDGHDGRSNASNGNVDPALLL